MKEKKSMKVRTILIIAFIIPQLLLSITQVFSYLTVNRAVLRGLSDTYLQSFHIFMGIEMCFCIALVTLICLRITRRIRISLQELSDAAREIAKGNVDITLVKKHNDEFGELVDAFQEVINNIKYESSIAEEVANGNLTLDVHPTSEQDSLGLALREMVDRNHNTLSQITDAAKTSLGIDLKSVLTGAVGTKLIGNLQNKSDDNQSK